MSVEHVTPYASGEPKREQIARAFDALARRYDAKTPRRRYDAATEEQP